MRFFSFAIFGAWPARPLRRVLGARRVGAGGGPHHHFCARSRGKKARAWGILGLPFFFSILWSLARAPAAAGVGGQAGGGRRGPPPSSLRTFTCYTSVPHERGYFEGARTDGRRRKPLLRLGVLTILHVCGHENKNKQDTNENGAEDRTETPGGVLRTPSCARSTGAPTSDACFGKLCI